jgi:hypothetical protein
MLTGLSAVTAAATWLTSRYRAWRQEKNRTRARNRHGFIMTNGIDDWYVRLIDDPQTLTPTCSRRAVVLPRKRES